LQNIRGLGARSPFVSTALVLSLFSIMGLPTLAFFPFRLALWEALASQAAWAVWISLLSMVGLLVAAMRVTISLVQAPEPSTEGIRESWQVLVLMGLAIMVLFLVGLFPQWFSPAFGQGFQTFQSLGLPR
jgi:NADH-quinone oxidoreductase subunit N